MRITLIDYSGHPFQAQLARALAERGHQVLHIHFSEFQTPKGQLTAKPGDPESLTFMPVSLGEPFNKHSLLSRRRQEREVGRRFAARIAEFAPEIVIASNCPLDTLLTARQSMQNLGTRVIFWQQDIYSEAMLRILGGKYGLLGRIVGLWYRNVERRLLRSSDAVVVIANEFALHIRESMGVVNVPIHVIENWAPLDEIPEHPKDNDWSREYGLNDKKVVLYSGTIGMKHDPSLILEIAEAMRKKPDYRMVVISEGPAMEWLAARKEESELDSLVLLNFQPYASLPKVLGSADILLCILEDDAGAFSVPSKVLSYLCAGRAIAYLGPETNLASKIIQRAGAGITLTGKERQDFASRMLNLLTEQETRFSMGVRARDYSEKTFTINLIAERFERVLMDTIAR